MTAALGIHSLPIDPVTSSLSQLAEPPPGVLRTRRAQPAHTKDIASVTTMSGTRDDDQGAVDGPEAQTQQEHAQRHDDADLLGLVLHEHGRDHAGEGHHRADREVDPAGDDDDRLGDGGERQRQDGMPRPRIPVTP